MKLPKRTKIVATVGPATNNEEKLTALARAGVNVFRLNFSHGDHQSHLQTIHLIQKIRQNRQLPIGILQDLSGPKIRLGTIVGNSLVLNAHDQLILDAGMKEPATTNRVGVNYPNFSRDVFPGARLLLADGELEVEVVAIEHPRVICEVLVGGSLGSHKGVNFPSGSFHLPALTEKDREDLEFGLQHGVDLVALSFVRSAHDLQDARKLMQQTGRTVPLIAKIEKHEAIEQIDEILSESDGIMIARGDLGVEIEIEKVPIIQKEIIRQANKLGIPVITATQMLRSMVNNPRPTRAEVTDVANAIFDGTDAVMLSEESAIGNYPVKAVEMMRSISRETELVYQYFHKDKMNPVDAETQFTESVAYSAVILARDIRAKFIFAVTRSGYTARMIAKFRPKSYIIALTPDEATCRALTCVWGVIPVPYPLQTDLNVLFKDALKIVRDLNLIEPGDAYVLTSGFPLGAPGSINQVKAGRFLF